jgi:hypothetical protein
MSAETNTAATTNVVGYFNPNQYRIYVEISELNLKCELNPGQYIRDRAGNYINDPIFEDYVQPKGLSKSTSETLVPINFVPRFVKSVRPVHAVTQATGFVRQPDGQVVPSYQQAPQTQQADAPINKNPIFGMTVDKARQLGLIGKPRIVPEDYGVTDGTGAPASGKDLPGMKYSIESPPKVRTAAPMTPELMEADTRLSPQEAQRRTQLQQNLSRASQVAPPESFDPSQVRPTAPAAPVRLVAPEEPTRLTAIKPAQAQPIAKRPAPAPAPHVPAAIPTTAPAIPKRILPKRVAAVVEETPEEPEQPEGEDQSGMIQPLQEGDAGMPDPVLEPPPAAHADTQPQEEAKRFICLADGKSFKYRSELERYVKRKYAANADELMKPYPAEG